VSVSLDSTTPPLTSPVNGQVAGGLSAVPPLAESSGLPNALSPNPDVPSAPPPRAPGLSVPPGRGVPPAVQPSVRPPVAPPAGGSAAEGQGPTVGRPPVTGGTPGSRSSVPSGSPV